MKAGLVSAIKANRKDERRGGCEIDKKKGAISGVKKERK